MKRTICIFLLAFLGFFSAAGGPGLEKVVIDPGHGGKDPGAVSKDGKTYEKTIVLDISKRLAKKINEGCPGVTATLTRGEGFISLADRAEKANKAGADLFISVHINSAPNGSANGFSVHTMGQSTRKGTDLYEYNLNVCRRENAVILLEDDHETRYEGFDPDDPESYIFMQLMQNAYLEQSLNFASIVKKKLAGGPIKADRGISQDPFYVLWKTSMPAVLLELGFISNQADLSALRLSDNREKLAQRIYEAFCEYKEAYDGSIDRGEDAGQGDAATGTPENAGADETLYGVQIFAVGRNIAPGSPEFLGYEARVFPSGKVNKYVIGLSKDLQSAKVKLREIRKKYPDAFLVTIRNGSISPQ